MKRPTWDAAYDCSMPIIKHLARRYQNNSTYLNYDDLVSAGLYGLMDAFKKFRPNKGACFATYAKHRIRGQILDEIRKNEWQTRTYREKVIELDKFRQQFEQKHRRCPDRKELEKGLRMKSGDWQKLQHGQNAKILPFSSKMKNIKSNQVTPEEELIEKIEKGQKVHLALQALPLKMRTVLHLRFMEEYTLKEVAKKMNLSEARIFQIQQQAMEEVQDLRRDVAA